MRSVHSRPAIRGRWPLSSLPRRGYITSIQLGEVGISAAREFPGHDSLLFALDSNTRMVIAVKLRLGNRAYHLSGMFERAWTFGYFQRISYLY